MKIQRVEQVMEKNVLLKNIYIVMIIIFNQKVRLVR